MKPTKKWTVIEFIRICKYQIPEKIWLMEQNRCLMQKSEALHSTQSHLICLELVGVKVSRSTEEVDCWNLHSRQQLAGSKRPIASDESAKSVSPWCEYKAFHVPQLVMSNHYVILKSLFQKGSSCLYLSVYTDSVWYFRVSVSQTGQNPNMSLPEACYQVRWRCVNSICSHGNGSPVVGDKVDFSAVCWKWHICHIVFPSRSMSCFPGVTPAAKTCLVTCLCQSPFYFFKVWEHVNYSCFKWNSSFM